MGEGCRSPLRRCATEVNEKDRQQRVKRSKICRMGTGLGSLFNWSAILFHVLKLPRGSFSTGLLSQAVWLEVERWNLILRAERIGSGLRLETTSIEARLPAP